MPLLLKLLLPFFITLTAVQPPNACLPFQDTNTPKIPTENNVKKPSDAAGRWIFPTDQDSHIICDYLGYRSHHGIDLYNQFNSPIYAARNGVVHQVQNSCPGMSQNEKECGGGYGNYITIKHDNHVYSRYAHLNDVYIKKGQTISAGQVIGTMGNSGRVGVTHLHFEIRQDPQGMGAGGYNPLDSTLFYYVFKSDDNSTKGGFKQVDGDTYYYQSDKKQTGWIQVENQWYYFDLNGIMQTGWIYQSEQVYYLSNTGALQVGFQDIDDHVYFFNKEGIMQTGWLDLNNEHYYFNEHGVMLTSWHQLNDQWHYFNEDGQLAKNTVVNNWSIDQDGIATPVDNPKYGWIDLGGNLFYFYPNGRMATNTSIDDFFIDETGLAVLYQGEDGLVSIGTKTYYFKNQKKQTGFQALHQNTYYFNKQGIMQTGWQTIKNKRYFFDSNGQMITGWKTLKDNTYFFNESGALQTGFKQIGNQTYYFGAHGVMKRDQWVDVDAKRYYIKDDGTVATGELLYQDQRYFLNEQGHLIRSGYVKKFKISPSGMAYLPHEINPDYVVNKTCERLAKLNYVFDKNLRSHHLTLEGEPGYEEALTESIVAAVIDSGALFFYLYVDGNTAHIYYQ